MMSTTSGTNGQTEGQTTHIVQTGECLATIAESYGYRLWETIYYAAENAEFRQKRPNPNVIYPGDEIAIPDKEQKETPGATEQKHRYRLNGTNWQLRVEVEDEGFRPIAGASYELYIESELVKQECTGSDGLVEADVPAGARSGLLKVLGEEIDLRLGGLDPISRVKGIQQRLSNMGFDPGAIDGVVGPKTVAAVMAFQAARDELEPNGQIDDDTRRTLLEAHDNDDRLLPAEEDMGPKDPEPDPGSSDTPGPGGYEQPDNVPPALPDGLGTDEPPTEMDLNVPELLIRGAQERLFHLGFDPGPIDGIDGPLTQAGVRAFQQFCKDNAGGCDPTIIDSGPVDGIVGPLTKAALESHFGC